MFMKRFYSILILLAVFTISCGEKFEEIKNVAQAVKNAPEAAENISKSMEKAEKRVAERRAKGDTLAMHFTELQKFLPNSISGFKAEEPEGQTTNVTGFSMTTAERNFTAEDGSGRNIKVALIDYNEAYAMFAGVAYWASLGLSTENSDGYQRTIKQDNEFVAGFEEYSKSGKNAKLSYAIGERFILTIEESNASSGDFVKQVAKLIDIKKLSAL